MEKNRPCPCGSGQPFGVCCGPVLAGEKNPATAEQLMRSRYTANVKPNAGYLLKTWHPSTRPDESCKHFNDWYQLNIIETVDGGRDDNAGIVEFRALYRHGALRGTFHERSRFRREKGRWYYLDGEILESNRAIPAKVGRNSPCPCGSGRKYKKCCLHLQPNG